MKIKKNIIIIIINTLLLNPFQNINITKAENENSTIQTKTCITTAYYSPQPNQRAYLKFNLEDEKRLNGNGTNGADGTKVFLGMIAADKNIPFGTKIYIEGIGLFEVRDRGSAIKDTPTNMRIDIWMGHGEEGLAKALIWGSRRQTCIIYPPNANIPEEYKNFKSSFVWNKLPQKDIDFIISKLNERNAVNNNVLLNSNITNDKINEIENIRKKLLTTKTLKYKDKSENILILNKYLKKLNYDVDETDEFNIKTFNAIKNFQLSQNIIASENDISAGYYGPKTSKILVEYLEKNINQNIIKENIAKMITNDNANKIKQKNESNYILIGENKINLENQNKSNINNELKFNLTLGMTNDEVLLLQKKLIFLNYLNRIDPTNYFDLEVAEAVFNYQKDRGIVQNKTDYGAGWVGPKTRKALNNEVIIKSNNEEIILIK